MLITDTDFHNDYLNGNAYTFPSPAYAQTVADLNTAGAAVLTVFAGSASDGLLNARDLNAKTGGNVPASAFGGTACNTGLNGAAVPPDALGGLCSTVFLVPAPSTAATGLTTAATQAITVYGKYQFGRTGALW